MCSRAIIQSIICQSVPPTCPPSLVCLSAESPAKLSVFRLAYPVNSYYPPNSNHRLTISLCELPTYPCLHLCWPSILLCLSTHLTSLPLPLFMPIHPLSNPPFQLPACIHIHPSIHMSFNMPTCPTSKLLSSQPTFHPTSYARLLLAWAQDYKADHSPANLYIPGQIRQSALPQTDSPASPQSHPPASLIIHQHTRILLSEWKQQMEHDLAKFCRRNNSVCPQYVNLI